MEYPPRGSFRPDSKLHVSEGVPRCESVFETSFHDTAPEPRPREQSGSRLSSSVEWWTCRRSHTSWPGRKRPASPTRHVQVDPRVDGKERRPVKTTKQTRTSTNGRNIADAREQVQRKDTTETRPPTKTQPRARTHANQGTLKQARPDTQRGKTERNNRRESTRDHLEEPWCAQASKGTPSSHVQSLTYERQRK